MATLRTNIIRVLIVAFALLASLFAAARISFAASLFTDVTVNHPDYTYIMQLVKDGVVNGNPDGTFRPNESVNRAAMLKMLYLAAGITPNASAKKCFSDVEAGSWYESFVCDAVSRNFVQGYSTDRTFRPNQAVNRAEALKMTFAVFGIAVPEVSAVQKDIVHFADVAPDSWYVKFVYRAYSTGIMPLPGQDTSYFTPGNGLLRGEAAALIVKAKMYKETLKPTAASSAATVATSSAPAEKNSIFDVPFPFANNGTFTGKHSVAYRFTIDAKTLVQTDVTTPDVFDDAGIRCTLFKISDDGFSDTYYLGIVEGKACRTLALLEPGKYQLEVTPLRADIHYTVSGQRGSGGDGNDGFSEASTLKTTIGQKPETIGASNLENWYTFSVTDLNGQDLTIELSNGAVLRCTVYALADVNVYGFTGPACNEKYHFTPGTYMVSVARKDLQPTELSYVIRLKK